MAISHRTGWGDRIVARRFENELLAGRGISSRHVSAGVIGRNGRLAATVDGSSFAARPIGDLIERELRKQMRLSLFAVLCASATLFAAAETKSPE